MGDGEKWTSEEQYYMQLLLLRLNETKPGAVRSHGLRRLTPEQLALYKAGYFLHLNIVEREGVLHLQRFDEETIRQFEKANAQMRIVLLSEAGRIAKSALK